MKTLLHPLLMLLCCSFCLPAANDTMHMPGVYNMLSQSVTDGTQTQNYPSKQVKIYTDHYVMYANVNPQDSSASFGIGTYSESGNNVIEHMMYSSSGNSSNDTVRTFTLNIEKTSNGYKQVIPHIDAAGKYTLTEEYQTVASGAGTQTPMDGAWKQTKAYYINGTDTTQGSITQFKTYYNGHFIWGHTYTDSASEKHTGMGFGTFEMDGDNKVKETIERSSYPEINGRTFDIDIAMMGADSFKQTIHNTDGTSGIEVYERLKNEQ